MLLINFVLIIQSNAYSQQKYYKWKDAQGNIHYGSQPPENKKSSEVKIQSNTAESPQQNIHQEDGESKKKTVDERITAHYEKKKEKKKKRLKNKKRCKVAKQLKAKFSHQARFSKTNYETGEKTYLSDKQRAQIMKKSNKAIRQYCN